VSARGRENGSGERGDAEPARLVVARGWACELGGQWAPVERPHAGFGAPAEVTGCDLSVPPGGCGWRAPTATGPVALLSDRRGRGRVGGRGSCPLAVPSQVSETVAAEMSVQKVVRALTSKIAEIDLSMAGTRQHYDTGFILVPAVGRTSCRGALGVLYCKAPWCL
jgi:hypothetical protein